MPANTRSHTPSRLQTISWPPARMTVSTTELTTRATLAITIAPTTALIRAEPSLRQMVQVAADRPARMAKTTALFTIRGPPQGDPFVQPRQHLVDPREGPHLEKWRPLHRGPLPHEALPRLLRRLARSGRPHGPGQAVRMVDRGPLGEVIQVLHLSGVEDDDRDRLVGMAVPLPQEFVHEIGVRGVGGIRSRFATDVDPVAREDAELESSGFGQSRERRDRAAAVRRPLFRDHENLRRAARLRGQPSDRRDLVVVEPQPPVPGPERAAPVHAFGAAPPAGLAREVLGCGDERHVLLEGHPAREAFRRHDGAPTIRRHGQSAPMRWRPRRRNATAPATVRTACW